MSSFEDEGIIDVEKRSKSVNYNLGDPTIFPPEFLAWLKRYIEQSGITLPASSIFGTFTAGAGSVRTLTPGLILAYGSSTPPAGALACDGTAVSRTTYAALFTAIGTTWGVGDGSTTFNVPDLRDRALYGKGTLLASVAGTDGGALGTRGPKHYHTAQSDGAHGHAGSTADSGGSHGHTASSNSTGSHSHGGGTGTAGAHSNHPGGGMTISGPIFTLTGAGQAWINGDISQSAGDHSHSIGSDGGHSHTITVDAGGAHTHTLTIASGGAHTHTTTGGGVVDTPAYATVLYVITTG